MADEHSDVILISLRLPRGVAEGYVKRAQHNDRSRNAEIVRVLARALAEDDERRGAEPPTRYRHPNDLAEDARLGTELSAAAPWLHLFKPQANKPLVCADCGLPAYRHEAPR